MSKQRSSKRRKHSRGGTKSAPSQPPNQQVLQTPQLLICRPNLLTRIWKVFRWIFAGILAAFAFGASALAYFSYIPRVFVAPPSAKADPSRPFSEPFTLTNTGAIPIYSVRVECGPPTGIGFSFTSGPPVVESNENLDIKGEVKESVFSANEIRSQERHPVPCFGFIPESFESSMGRSVIVSSAYVDIEVQFRILGFIPKIFSTSFPFQGSLKSDGTVHWSEPPLSELPTSATPTL
jgi:hypothetical protein